MQLLPYRQTKRGENGEFVSVVAQMRKSAMVEDTAAAVAPEQVAAAAATDEGGISYAVLDLPTSNAATSAPTKGQDERVRYQAVTVENPASSTNPFDSEEDEAADESDL